MNRSAASAHVVVALVALVSVFPAVGAFAPTTRVSVDSAGNQANGWSVQPSISADGRYVAFESVATNLVTGDTNSEEDIFVFDRQTGQTTRVSIASNGTQGNARSRNASISADGRYVAFDSQAANLVPGDTNIDVDVFVHDRQLAQTTRVSVATDGTEGNQRSDEPAISADGRYVAFASNANNLVAGDTNFIWDIFVHDRQTAQTTRVSLDSAGNQGNGLSEHVAISADGRYVAFTSAADNLVWGDTNGEKDVFVHDRQTGNTTRVSVDSAGNQGNGISRRPAISGDGRYVAFVSSANNLVAGDTNGRADAFVHDRQTGQTTRVSVDSAGNQGNEATEDLAISEDGRHVAFRSLADNLIAGDTNGRADIFRHDRQTGQTIRVSVGSAGTQANSDSESPSINGDGQAVAFWSNANNLVPGDTNGLADVFVRDLSAPPPPTVTAITPVSGTNDGAVNVTITGTGFRAGATVRLTHRAFADIIATAVNVVSATQITCTFDLNGAFVEPRNVVVANDDAQTDELPNGFHVGAPLGAYDEDFETGDLSKHPWQTGGDANWFVTETDRHSGRYSARAGAIGDGQSTYLEVTRDCQAGNITFFKRVSSEGSYDLLRFYIDGVHQAGWSWSGDDSWNPVGQVSIAVAAGTRTFRWEYAKDATLSAGEDTAWIDDITFPPAPVVHPPPTVTAIAPDTGTNDGAANVTITGTGFRAGATASLERAGQPAINATALTVVSGTEITCTFDLTGAAAGDWNVVVTNDDAQSGTLADGFTVAAPTAPAPTVTAIAPDTGTNDGSVNATITGTNFRAGASARLTRAGQPAINATALNVVSGTEITCTFDLTGATTGAWNVMVTNDDAQSGTLSDGFTVAAPTHPAPTVTSITPDTGTNDGPVNVSIIGTNFRAGATARLTRAGQPAINATAVTWAALDMILCTFDLTGAAPGAWNVVVTNDDAQAGTLAGGFTVEAPVPTVAATFPAGLQMVSLPVIPVNPDPAQLGFEAGRWARWDPTLGDYRVHPHSHTRFDPAASVPGKGYWARFAAQTTATVAGVPPADTAYAIQASAGWSQMGNPRLVDVPWRVTGAGALRVRRGAQEKTLAEAQAAGWCEDFAWAYQAGAGYQLVYDSSVSPVGAHNVLEPWSGYWFRAHEPVELIFPAVGTASAGATRPPAQRAEGEWSISILAALQDGSAAQAVVGQAAQARQMELPPGFGGGVEMSVVEGAHRLGVDLREVGGAPVWTLEATTTTADARVTLQWPDLSEVPGDYRPVLLDLATGKRTYMRTSRGYTYTADAAGTRRFEVRVAPSEAGALTVTGAAAVAGGGTVELRVTLSAAATVDAEVLSIAGRQVATVCRGREMEAGAATVLWNATSDRGTRLPSGKYLIRVTARADDGQQTSIVTPLQLGR